MIRTTARRLARRPGFTEADREDIEQELALELLQRCGEHDPERGTPVAFAAGVLRQRVADILRERRTRKRGGRNDDVSLDHEVWSEDGEGAEALEEGDGQRRLGANPLSDLERCELRLDADAVLARLPERLRGLCELLKEMSVAEAARHMGVTRAALRGDLRRLRDLFVTFGVTFDFSAPSRDPIP